MLWHQLISDLKYAEKGEADFHPHVQQERSNLFHIAYNHNADFSGTEFEVQNFLHAMVLMLKSKNILETGTEYGYTTLALGAACKFNGFGKVTTVDYGVCTLARERVEQYDLSDMVNCVQSNALDFAKTYDGEPFDFLFFDSDLSTRTEEYETLRLNGKVAHGAFVAFHDTSEERKKYFPDTFGYSDKVKVVREIDARRGFTSELSRGIQFFHAP